MKTKNLFLIISTLFVAFAVYGATIKDDKLRIGKPGSALDKEVQLGTNQKIRANQTSGKLEFSNDGTNFKDIGSGSGGGGGVNLLTDQNADFESSSPPDNWTKSGAATFVSETTNPLFGDQSGKLDFSAASENLDSNLVAIEEGFVGQKCQAEIHYRWPAGSSGDIKLQALDQTPSVLTEVDLEPTTSNDTRKAQLFFDCPALGDSLRMRLTSTADAAEIVIDSAFLGTGKNTFQLAQTTLVAHAFYPTVANCFWQRNSSSFGDFTPDTDCISISVIASTQDVDTTDNDLPDIDFDILTSGVYYVEAVFALEHNDTTGADLGIRISDGSTTGPKCGRKNDASGRHANVKCSATFTYTSSGARNFKLTGFENGTGAMNIKNNNDAGNLVWRVIKYPSKSAEAITLETVGFIAGARLTSVDKAHVSTSSGGFTPFTVGTMSLANKTGKSSSLMIPCTPPNAPTGDDCPVGLEEVGISWIADAGDWKVCFSGSEFYSTINGGAADNITHRMKQGETTETSDTIIQEGLSIDYNVEGTSNSTTSWSDTHQNCNIYRFDSSGRKVVRLFEDYTLGTGATITHNWDDSFSGGWSVTVEKISEQKPTPVFTDLTDALDSRIEADNQFPMNFAAGAVSNGGTPTINDDYNNGTSFISSLVDLAIGRTQMNFTAGVFDGVSNIRCVCSTNANNAVCMTTISGPTAIEFRTTTGTSGNLVDQSFNFICYAKR